MSHGPRKLRYAAGPGHAAYLHRDSGVLITGDSIFLGQPVTEALLDRAQPTLLPSPRLHPLVLGLGVDPARCVAVEDSANGIRSSFPS